MKAERPTGMLETQSVNREHSKLSDMKNTLECGPALLRFPVMDGQILSELSSVDGVQLAAYVRRALGDPFVREAIYLASPSLLERVMEWEAGSGNFREIEVSIARYLLRMAFRATPFGTFSAVSTCTFNSIGSSLLVPPRNALARKVQIDSTALSAIARRVISDADLRKNIKWSVNDTLVVNGDVGTYVAFDAAGPTRRIYKKVEIEWCENLAAIRNLLKLPKTSAEIVELASHELADKPSHEELSSFIDTLIESQLLCCDDLVDITSGSLLKNAIETARVKGQFAQSLSSVDQKIQLLCGSHPITVPEDYLTIRRELKDCGVEVDERSLVKVDLHCEGDCLGSLPASVLDQTKRALGKFLRFHEKSAPLAGFVARFERRFGDSEVPLSIIANELESLGFPHEEVPLPELARVLGNQHQTRHGPLKQTSQEVEVAGRILSHQQLSAGENYIDVTSYIDDQIGSKPITASTNEEYDLSLMAWLSLWDADVDDLPTVEIRGVSVQEPGKIMGRFAGQNETIRRFLESLPVTQDEVLAELVHLPQDRVGNVTARPSLSAHELRIRGGVGATSDAIHINDVLVSVSRGKVKLRSKRLNAYISLRMSNAHNYDARDNLGIYRFLNHIASQGMVADWFSLRRTLPDAPFVPGVVSDGVVISRPLWLICAEDAKALRKASPADRRAMIEAWRCDRNLPTWITLVEGDNVIPYCLDNSWMVDDLCRSIVRQGRGELSDLYPLGMRPYLRSEQGRKFNEIVLPLRQRAKAARQITLPGQPGQASEAVKSLWSDWAYIKVYAPWSLHADVLREVNEVASQLKSAGDIDRFYFVRFEDEDGPHLRLRFGSDRKPPLPRIVEAVGGLFANLTASRSIHNVTVEEYVRELTRYGGEDGCTVCEEIFSEDSQVAIEYLNLSAHRSAGLEQWIPAAYAIDTYLRAFGLDSALDRVRFAERAARGFALEMSLNSADKRRIGAIFRSTPPIFDETLAPTRAKESWRIFESSIAEIKLLWNEFESAAPETTLGKRYEVQWSLIHMRMNRILGKAHRIQEAVIWELLKRSYKRAINSKEKTNGIL